MDEQLSEQPQTEDSLDDKIAAKFGGNDAPQEQPQEQPEQTETPAEDTFELEYEGERFSLPKRLEKAVMQERDYTQKSQSLADLRRQLELKESEFKVAQMERDFSKEVSDQIRQLQMYDAALAQPVDWASLNTDEAFRKKLQLDQWKEERQALLNQVQSKRAEFEQKQRTEADKLKTQAMETLRKRIPNWSDEVAKEVRGHAVNEGYSESELSGINDTRYVMTLWKAMQYDKLQSKASEAVNKVKAPIRPTPSNPMDQKTKDYLKFRKTITAEKPNSANYKQALSDRIASKFGG